MRLPPWLVYRGRKTPPLVVFTGDGKAVERSTAKLQDVDTIQTTDDNKKEFPRWF